MGFWQLKGSNASRCLIITEGRVEISSHQSGDFVIPANIDQGASHLAF